jgi:PhnB protein
MNFPNIQVYLNFNGCCEEAVEFYRQKLDAEVNTLMRFKDAPPSAQECSEGHPQPPADKIMHSCFKIGDTHIMASDCESSGQARFEGFSLTLNVEAHTQAEHYFSALAEEGKIEMPLGETFWSPCFGMVRDRYGIAWMINVFTPCGE